MAFDDFDDLAAEPEIVRYDASRDSSAPDDDKPLFRGICKGGPLAETTVESRFPVGFLLIDKATARVWIYDHHLSEPIFECRSSEPYPLLEEGPDNRWRAADEGDYDIRVLEVPA